MNGGHPNGGYPNGSSQNRYGYGYGSSNGNQRDGQSDGVNSYGGTAGGYGSYETSNGYARQATGDAQYQDLGNHPGQPGGYGYDNAGSHSRRQGGFGREDYSSYSEQRGRQYGYPDGGANEGRSGGYGGFAMSPTDSGSTRPSAAALARADDKAIRRRSGDRSGASRSRTRAGAPSRNIEDVLQYIKSDWSFMTEDNCVPVAVALQLLDESSLGLANRYDEFHGAQRQLQSALKAIVNEHHQGFNSSIGTFHQIQASIQASHERIRHLKESLLDAKTNLTSTKLEHKNLSTSSQSYGGMLDVLQAIEQLQQKPELLEARISEKRFISAVDELQEALSLIRKPELDNLGALADMRVYFSNQEHSLTDILTEELHNHLYLKSPYCEDRWTAYTKKRDGVASTTMLNWDSWPRQMYSFLDELDTSSPMKDDSSKNPEAESYHYIYLIAESLTKLGRLEDAVNAIEERLPVELFKVVERTNIEIQQRHPKAVRNDWTSKKGAGLDLPAPDDKREVVLDDLLGTMYSRFEAIAEAHRVFYEVVYGITQREDGMNTQRLTRGFKELWKLYQSEIRSLLHDYLSNDGSGAQRFGTNAGHEGNIFRYQRDKNKKCTFKLELLDNNDADLKLEREEVVGVWQRFVPGLVSLDRSNRGAAGTTNGGMENSATGHKLLVDPNVFNITSLLPPSISFLRRLREVVPPASDIVISTLTNFLNDFLVNVFQPQLEETLSDFCRESFMQLDAFQEDPLWDRHSQKPIFKGAVRFFEIITAFCRMLDDLTHDQTFSQLVIQQMDGYYDKCKGWYKALVSKAEQDSSGRSLKVAAALAESGDVCDVARKIWLSSDESDLSQTYDDEVSLLISTFDKEHVVVSDLLSDRKTQASLCLLYTSMKWLASKLANIRHISDRAMDSSGMQYDDEDKPNAKRSLTTAIPTTRSIDASDPVYLPLNSETAGLFDGVVGAFRDLASTVLRTLHLEVRCEILQALGASIQGSFLYTDPSDAPDEHILRLVTDLLEFNQELTKYLQPQEKVYITKSSSQLIDAAMVHKTANQMVSLNYQGSKHMELCANVLYHNLLNVDPDADLPRSFAYFKLFGQGADAVMEASKAADHGGFNREEFEALLRLWYSERLESSDTDEAARARRGLDERLQQLGESFK